MTSTGTPRFVVAGTDTGVGKTVLCAALVVALDGIYWKPVQAGTAGGTDTETVARLSGLPPDRLLPEAYRLAMPASPHLAAARERIEIRQHELALPSVRRPLVIEGAGGLMVPLSMQLLQIDLYAAWGVPVILCARTRLGTINHTLLSIEALRRRRVPIHGLAFVGAKAEKVEETIVSLAGVRRLGRLPRLKQLDRASLAAAFAQGFDLRDLVSA